MCQESAAHTYRNVATYFKRNIFYIHSVVGLHFIAHFYMWSCLGFWKDSLSSISHVKDDTLKGHICAV